MATAQQLSNAAADFDRLSLRQLLVVQTYLLATSMGLPAQSAVTQAKDFDRLSDRELEVVIAYALSNGGGAGGLIQNFAGKTPNIVPASGSGMAIDTSNGSLWFYYNGAWHFSSLMMGN